MATANPFTNNYFCGKCGFTCLDITIAIQHSRVHHKRRYQCRFIGCTKKLKNEQTLAAHVTKFHSKVGKRNSGVLNGTYSVSQCTFCNQCAKDSENIRHKFSCAIYITKSAENILKKASSNKSQQSTPKDKRAKSYNEDDDSLPSSSPLSVASSSFSSFSESSIPQVDQPNLLLPKDNRVDRISNLPSGARSPEIRTVSALSHTSASTTSSTSFLPCSNTIKTTSVSVDQPDHMLHNNDNTDTVVVPAPSIALRASDCFSIFVCPGCNKTVYTLPMYPHQC